MPFNHENPSRIAEVRRISVQKKSILRPQIQRQQHEVLHKNAGLKRHLNSANLNGFSCF